MANRTAKRLLHLLETEHAAITAGEFSAIADIGAEKETLFSGLQDRDMADGMGEKLAAATHRNQVLLQSAMRGMQAAVDVMHAKSKASQGSVVYGSDGTVSRLASGDQRLSQKL